VVTKMVTVTKRKASLFRLTFSYLIESKGLVRRRGLEPLCLAALAPQASASANFATSALRPDTHGCVRQE
jgi:hypothetical protein